MAAVYSFVRREDRLIGQIMVYLRQRGCYAIRTHGHDFGEMGVCRPGIPDIVACYRGRFLGIEVKTRKGGVRAMQRREMEAVRESHGVGFVARDVEDVRRVLAVIDRRLATLADCGAGEGA